MTSKVIFVPKTEYAEGYIPRPELAIKNIPEWYRTHEIHTNDTYRLSKDGTVNNTVKKCVAVFDAMTSGYLLKVPADIFIDATGKRIVYTQANIEDSSIISMHTPEQVKGLPFDRSIYMDEIFRIHPQWLIKTEDGYSSMFFHPMFHEDLSFRAISGVIDTDGFMSDGAFSILIKKGFKGVIEKGTPLIQVVPFKREEYEIEVGKFKDYETEIIQQRMLVRSRFQGGYKRDVWKRKKYG